LDQAQSSPHRQLARLDPGRQVDAPDSRQPGHDIAAGGAARPVVTVPVVIVISSVISAVINPRQACVGLPERYRVDRRRAAVIPIEHES
jgi:hypothetical protein